MDEPLSNLDAKLRNQMRAELIKLRQRIDTTFIYVTHDQTEAMTLGDRIVIMKDGIVQQVGTPQEVFDHPANIFVAGFIGMPQMNMFDAKLVEQSGKYSVELGGVSISSARQRCHHRQSGRIRDDGKCDSFTCQCLWKRYNHHCTDDGFNRWRRFINRK